MHLGYWCEGVRAFLIRWNEEMYGRKDGILESRLNFKFAEWYIGQGIGGSDLSRTT